MIAIGKGGQRAVKTTLLSRYACYLIVQNADPSKEIVALGRTGQLKQPDCCDRRPPALVSRLNCRRTRGPTRKFLDAPARHAYTPEELEDIGNA